MTQTLIDFNTSTAGGLPSGWTRRHAITAGGWTVTNGAAYDGAKGLAGFFTTSGRNLLACDALDGVSADVEIYRRIKFSAGLNGDGRCVLRGSGAAGSENGYVMGPVNGGLRIGKLVAGVSTNLGADFAFTTTTGVWFNIVYRVNGTSLSVKIWADGDTEPGSPQKTITDSSVTAAGWNGIHQFVNTGTTTDDRYVGFGTAGDAAPRTPSAALDISASDSLGITDDATFTKGASILAPDSVGITDTASFVKASPGVLLHALGGALNAGGFTVKARTFGTAVARLAVSTNSGLTSPSYFTGTIDSDGYAPFVVTGLAANTLYYWAVELDGVLNTAMKGQARTSVAVGTPNNFSFVAGSCVDTGRDNDVLDRIRIMVGPDSLQARFFAQLGDINYWWISTLARVRDMNPATFRVPFENQFQLTRHAQLFRTIPVEHVWSDNDAWRSNTDGTDGFKVPAGTAHRQVFPSSPFPDSGAIYRSWIVGRVRFVITDERYYASAIADAQTSGKTKLGTTQKAWFKAQIDAAVAANQVVVWFGDGLWIGPPSLSSNNDGWSAYNNERVELGNYIVAAGAKLVRIHGDTHTLAADSGANNPYGGFPYWCSAPVDRDANPWFSGWGTPDAGSWPTSAVQAKTIGWFDIADSGASVALTGTLYSTTGGVETQRVQMTKTWDLSLPVDATDNVGITDAAAFTKASVRPATDPVGITDTAVFTRGAAVAPSDPVAIGDMLVTTVGFTRTAADTVGIADSAGFVRAATLSPTDPVGITDMATFIRTGADQANATDPVSVTDSATFVITATRLITDPVGVVDGAVFQLSVAGSITDTDPVGITDTAAVTASMVRVATDPVGLVDGGTFQLTPAGGITAADPLALADTAVWRIEASRVLTDPVGIGDSATFISSAAGTGTYLQVLSGPTSNPVRVSGPTTVRKN